MAPSLRLSVRSLLSCLCASQLVLEAFATCDSSTSERTETLIETCPDTTTSTVVNFIAEAPTTPATTTSADEECGVWLALSTLPGTGIGMFAGKAFRKDENFLSVGDHIIPIVDFQLYKVGNFHFLWDDYTWSAESLYLDDLGLEGVDVASPGFGSAANSFLDFVNTEELYQTYSIPNGLHRRSDPGAGAFTYYHSRWAKASSDITPGEELFVTYGNEWFLLRQEELGPIPIQGDHERADALYRKYRQFFTEMKQRKLHTFSEEQTEDTERNQEQSLMHDAPSAEVGEAVPPPTHISHILEMEEELWNTFVLSAPWEDSPTMAALPPKEEYEAMYTQTLLKLRKSQMFRDTEWLQENGVCADTMYFGLSTIRQAGHGAFASRRLRQDAIVLPIPLIHIPDRRVLNMYALSDDPIEESVTVNRRQPTRPQLLLNYCLGHRHSTLLLSPYGPVFNLINHNQTLANVRLQWASPQRSQHNPDLLNMNMTQLREIHSSQLAMELVALRDIEPGEEIFLDYGDEWEAAWQKHVQEWKPVEGAETYVSAFEMNQQLANHRFRTESERKENPYPANLMLKFHMYFHDTKQRRSWIKEHPSPVTNVHDEWLQDQSVECEILRYKEVENRTLYAVVILDDQVDDDWTLLEDVPQEAIFFQDQPYTTDMFLKNAFRHDLRIPDNMFPDAWKNLVRKSS